MTKDMTTGSPLRIILLFSIPVLLGNLFQQFYNMVDTIIVGRYLGEEALVDGGKINGHSCLLLQLEKTCGGRDVRCSDRASSAATGSVQWTLPQSEDCLSESEYPAVRPHW